MLDEIATQSQQEAGQTAQAEDLAGSAPAQETAANTESATENAASGESATVENPDQTAGGNTGSAPGDGEEPKAVQELKRQRKLRQEAEAQAAYWRGQAQAPQQQQPQASQQASDDPNYPKIENFESYEDWTRAVIKHETKQTQQVQQQQQVVASYNARLVEAEKVAPGLTMKIQNALNTGVYPRNEDILTAIMESENGPEVAGYLADNPTTSFKLAQLPTNAALREIGKIEGKLSVKQNKAQPARQISQAPKPLTPVSGGSGKTQKSLADMTDKEFIEHRNKLEFGMQ